MCPQPRKGSFGTCVELNDSSSGILGYNCDAGCKPGFRCEHLGIEDSDYSECVSDP
jgi:hypothetical protein